MSRDGAIRPPAHETTIAHTEKRYGIRFPEDMASFYRSMNGMDWPTEPDNGWIRFWDLDSWRRIRDEPGLRDVSIYGDFENAILIADHCDSSWWYAADFSGARDQLTIYLFDGLRPAKPVASTFTAFVNAALADAADIYPDDRAAG